MAEDNYQDQIQELRGMILKIASTVDIEKKTTKDEDQEDDDNQEDVNDISNKSLISLH